jgi:hypothetical protein
VLEKIRVTSLKDWKGFADEGIEWALQTGDLGFPWAKALSRYAPRAAPSGSDIPSASVLTLFRRRDFTLDLGSWSPKEVPATTLVKVRRALVEIYSAKDSKITSLKVEAPGELQGVLSLEKGDFLRAAEVSLRDRDFGSRWGYFAGAVGFLLSCNSELRRLDLG